MVWLIQRWLLLVWISLSLFKGSWSFFVRHSQTGKCVVPRENIYNENWGIVDYAKLNDTCLDDDAQFYYTDNKLLRNREQSGTFLTRGRHYDLRFVLYYGKNAEARKTSDNEKYSVKQTIHGSLKMKEKGFCVFRTGSDEKLGRATACADVANQKFTFGSVTQFNSKMKDVHCSKTQRMAIKKANYGDFNKSGTFVYNTQIDTGCSSLANCEVKTRCGGNRSCELTFDSNLLPSQYCPDNSKEIYTEYTCVDINKTKAGITTAPNIRLSDSGNEGFIETKDVLIWRKVEELKWDKDLQKMLCQHLGFNETDKNDIVRKEVASGQEIASGHLVYNNTQPSGPPSCVYLEPSTTSSKVNLPYVTCKICDKPLLQDEATFSDSVFSGVGRSNSYKEARFSNDGLCATGSGTNYLWINLQKEYHITRIVTLGDRNQTKWSGSYSFKYSHNKTLVDGTSAVQLKGNQNGYHASSTTVNIYNVRYLKIQSGSTDFCLRIELCGEVQSPAPVTKLVVTPSNFSVHLSWATPGSKTSSYITHFIIYLNDTEKQTISRQSDNNQFTALDGLTPYTTYTVAIVAQDGNSEKSKSNSATFTTKEAVPNGPPLKVTFISRGKKSLEVSWKAPDKSLQRGKITGYNVCHSTSDTTPVCHKSTTLSFTISDLQPSTKYSVTVAAGTKVGYGNKSSEISKITNGEPVNPVPESYSSLRLSITKPANYIKEVMVVVQMATSNSRATEDIPTKELKPHGEIMDGKNPYITAFFEATKLPLTFVIGDGKEYNSAKQNYSNPPLKQNSSYIVFLRFFESQDIFFSTDWSESVKTMVMPPAPRISSISSTVPKRYEISWIQPTLPGEQHVQTYNITYGPLDGTDKTKSSTKQTSLEIDVEYNKQYKVYLQVETNAGKSNVTSKSWRTISKPLDPAKKTGKGYMVKLRKPTEETIKTVALVLLQLQSKSSTPTPPEEIEFKDLTETPPTNKQETNVAFIASEFNVTDFQEDTIEITLQEAKETRRRKREAHVVKKLAANVAYRTAQVNSDESGSYIWSYWSEPFTVGVMKPPSTTEPVSTGDPGPSDSTGGPGGAGGASGEGDGSNAAAIGASVGVVVLIVILVIAIIFFRRRRIFRKNSEKDVVSQEEFDEMTGLDNGGRDGRNSTRENADKAANEGIYSNETGFEKEQSRPPVPVSEFAHYVNELKANDNSEFQSQYNDLPTDMETSWEVSKKPFNKKKNRYGNIVTYDHCRVVLSGDEEEDYVNASFMDGMETNSYIATQGPTVQTVNDMWRMVWEQRTYSIVMVTSLVELGKPKCERYWPGKGTKKYGDIEVTLVKTEEFAYHVTHTLRIIKDGEEREVRHYYYSSWPDHGVPKYPTQLLAFRRHFRTAHLKQSGPIVVHCSAGVGRTGVFLAIDMILEKLEKGLISSIDVFGQVCAMRERRMNMIQTLEQYIFVHDAILETILCGMNEVNSNRIKNEVENLARHKAGGMTGFQEKFKRLGEVSPKLTEEECAAGVLEENYNKNRIKNVYPAESSRVPLKYIEGVESSDYINAAFVHGYLGRDYFISTQSPLPNTINDFWRLVHSQKSSTIVLLNNVKEGTSFPKFWPTERGKPTQYGNMTVQLDSESENANDGIWTRKFILSPYPDLSDGQVVNIFHYTKWSDHRVPANANGVISLTSLVEKSRQSYGQGPVIVACSDGAGRTGTYIAISNLLERMKIEQAVDVFQAIKIIRGVRPQFVETAEQYQFCYTAMMAYLVAFSDYANFE